MFSTVFLLIGVLLLSTRTPALHAIAADETGIRFTLGAGSAPFSVPWAHVEAIGLNAIHLPFATWAPWQSPGHVMWLRIDALLPLGHTVLRPFVRSVADGGSELIVGLNREQNRTLVPLIPTLAGPRYRTGRPAAT